MADQARHLVVVPHTHWDREWYRTFESFRYRLVRLLDGLLDLLDRDPEFRHFTLDGQSIVLADYLDLRPQQRERLEKRIREGRLLVGPWWVLPDEWLVSGEALIRNLRLGLREADAMGGAMRIGYVPDQFGHVGQLPQIFAGFGFDAAVLWRGVGADVERTTFIWQAPDGTQLFTVYLPFGYGNAVHLPDQPDALLERLRFEVDRLQAMSDVPSLLLLNGSDHVQPRPDLPRALEQAAAALGASFEIGTLPAFVAQARAACPEPRARHRGELRSGLRAPLLPGCASARLPLKQADFANDRLLLRYLEPIAAWLGALGGEPDVDVIEHAWRLALENHPHDSICGCSIDRVHDEMETRFRKVEEIARAHLETLAADWTGRVAVPARGFGRGARESLVVWNPHPSGPGQVEAELDLDLGASASCHLRDAKGRSIPATIERLERAQVLAQFTLPTSFVASLLPALDGEFAGLHAQAISWQRKDDRLHIDVCLGAAPVGLDLERVRRSLRAALFEEGVRQVRFRARRRPRVRLRFVDDLPGYGLRVYRVVRGAAPPGADGAPKGGCERDGRVWIENACWRVEVSRDGRVSLWSHRHGVGVEDALRVVSEGDRGDSYNFDPVPAGARVERPERVRVRLERVDAAEASILVEGRYRVPRGLTRDRQQRSRTRVGLPLRLRLRLARALDRIDLETELENRAEDHRLRLHLRAPFAARRFEVESAFEVVERPIAPAAADFGSARPAEFPIGACPQRAFASVDDGRLALCVANRGMAEVEAVHEDEGRTSLAVTLLRAVGWLSRDDLALRPGAAGPALPTPGAQVPGLHRSALSLRLHPVGEAGRVAEAHRFAHPALAFVGGGGPDAPLADGSTLLSLDEPAVLVSAIEPHRAGGALIRGYNASGERRRVRLRWNAADARSIESVDLAERPQRRASQSSGPRAVELVLRPWELFSLRIR